MDSKMIEAFLASAEQGSFARAAETLSVTPPSVMRQVNMLEQEVGVPLLLRYTRGVELTEAGKVFYSESQDLLRHLAVAAQRARRASTAVKKEVRLGISAMNPMGEFNRIWRSAPRREEFALSLINLPTDVNGMVSAERGRFRETDAVFCSGPVIDRFEEIGFCPLCSYPLTCAVPLSHPLAQRERILLKDLRGETILFPARSNGRLSREFSRDIAARDPGIRVETPPIFYDQQVFNYCAEHGVFLVSLPCWSEVHPDLIHRPTDWGREWTLSYGLIWRADINGVTADFIRAVEEGMESARRQNHLAFPASDGVK